MNYKPTQTQAAVTSGMANLNLVPPPPVNAASNPPPPLYPTGQPNFSINHTHMPLPSVFAFQIITFPVHLNDPYLLLMKGSDLIIKRLLITLQTGENSNN